MGRTREAQLIVEKGVRNLTLASKDRRNCLMLQWRWGSAYESYALIIFVGSGFRSNEMVRLLLGEGARY